MAAQKKVQARRMAQGHYMKDAFFFMQDLQEAMMEYEVEEFSQTDARYAQRLVEELDVMRPMIQKLANNLEANSPADIITNWKEL
tara:strand:- start:18 stop:272 length:255 start_codon:yes stop_codon:yes gene_type:complete